MARIKDKVRFLNSIKWLSEEQLKETFTISDIKKGGELGMGDSNGDATFYRLKGSGEWVASLWYEETV